MTCSEKSRRW